MSEGTLYFITLLTIYASAAGINQYCSRQTGTYGTTITAVIFKWGKGLISKRVYEYVRIARAISMLRPKQKNRNHSGYFKREFHTNNCEPVIEITERQEGNTEVLWK